MRVAYIDEVEDEEKKDYYSKLVKVVVSKDDDRNVTEQVHVNMPWFILFSKYNLFANYIWFLQAGNIQD